MSKVVAARSWPPTSIQCLRMSGSLRSPSIRPHNVIAMHTVNSTLTVHFTVIAQPSTTTQQAMLRPVLGKHPVRTHAEQANYFECDAREWLLTPLYEQSASRTQARCFVHAQCLCFTCFSQQTTINSLHNINRLAFLAKAHCVLCEVRNESSYILYDNVYNCKQCCVCLQLSHVHIMCTWHTHTHQDGTILLQTTLQSAYEGSGQSTRRGRGGDGRQKTGWLLAADWLDLGLPYSSK